MSRRGGRPARRPCDYHRDYLKGLLTKMELVSMLVKTGERADVVRLEVPDQEILSEYSDALLADLMGRSFTVMT